MAAPKVSWTSPDDYLALRIGKTGTNKSCDDQASTRCKVCNELEVSATSPLSLDVQAVSRSAKCCTLCKIVMRAITADVIKPPSDHRITNLALTGGPFQTLTIRMDMEVGSEEESVWSNADIEITASAGQCLSVIPPISAHTYRESAITPFHSSKGTTSRNFQHQICC